MTVSVPKLGGKGAMKTIASMSLLGGRPSLDLVNTVDARRDTWGPDLLVTHDDLLVWCERVGLLGAAELSEAGAAARADPAAAAAMLERIKRLREAIAQIIEAALAGSGTQGLAAKLLADEVDRARRHQRFTASDGRFLLAWQGEDPLERTAHRVALDAATLLTDDRRRGLVKLCSGPNCGWLFLDETKNASRRWCRDSCGAHLRVLRYRTKPR